jgi:hypothetical protein
MRRTSLGLALAAAVLLPLASAASAVGPGGWDHVGVGPTAGTPSLNGAVYALNSDAPGVLLVGGAFTSAGGVAHADRVATWNGTAWGSLNGTPISNGAVHALAYHAGKVYAGGTFINAGGNPDADFLAVWNGSGWAPFCNAIGPAFTANVNALEIVGNTLYVGGSFANGAGIAQADYLLACDLTTGASSSTVGSDGDINGGVYALAAASDGTLYAGGQFFNLAHITAADHVAAYKNGTWHAMGVGVGTTGGAVDGYVRSLAAWGTDVYVGTDSVNVAGIAQADHVARWNGSSWSALGSNTAGTNGWFTTGTFINALAVSGPLVFAAGSFQNANGVATADDIAYFDGTRWWPIGSNGAGNGPMIASMNALGVFRSNLFAVGNFTSAGGDVRAQGLASYALTLPDVRIGVVAAGPFAGNGVYSSTGVGESQTFSLAGGTSRAFYINIQNDGLVAASYTLKGTGSAKGYVVRYYRGATNVTAAVTAGTYSTGAVAARGNITLKMLVTRGRVTASSVTYVLTARSFIGTPADAVRAIVKAK